MSVRSRLEAAGLELPAPPKAVGEYVPALRAGSLVFTSGQLPSREGVLLATGLVGQHVPVETAQRCAEAAVLNALAAAGTVCDLDEVVSVVKLVGYVACDPDFTAQPAVLNAASACLVMAFGESGRHAREAIGVAALPLGAPVEVSLVLALDSARL